MLTENADGARRNRAAMFYMLPTVALGSLIPLMFVWGSGEDSPFLFNAAWRFGLVVGCAAFLLMAYPKISLDRKTLGVILPRLLSWAVLFTVIGNFDYTLFTWSLRFVDVSVSAILVEMWPIFLALLVYRLLGERYKPISLELIGLSALCLFGVAFVVNSQLGGSETHPPQPAYMVAIGSALAIGGALVAALTAFAFKWSADLSGELAKRLGLRAGDGSASQASESDRGGELELFCIVTAYLAGGLISSPINAAAGLLSGETIALTSLAIGLSGGILVQASASVLLRKSLLTTRDLGVSSMIYAVPALSLGWLWAFSKVDIARPDFLIIGAAGIIAANLLINFEAEIRFGFKSLIIALWACGAVVYLRPVDGALFGVENWEWTGTEYFAALALSATIFTLILSFRIARLASRTTEEENRSFAIFQKLDALVRRGAVSGEVRRLMLSIDVSEQRPENLRKAYDDAMTLISQAASEAESESDRERLGEVESELNALVHSKQRGIVFGELFALCVFAGITVALALFSRPEIFGWTAFLVETLAALFSAVIVFLIFNALDLQRERFGAILKKANGGGYRVAFDDVRSRVFERRVSVVVGLALAAAYIGLLWNKWIG